MGKIYKTLLFDGKVSLAILDTTDVVNKAIKYHKLTPLTSATLGRVMTACLFMASNLKNKHDRLSVTVAGDGVGGHVIVSADSMLNVRGLIDNPNAQLPLNDKGKLDVKGCVGKGRINVTRSTGLKEPYTSSCHIISGEIAEDFSFYYTVSEQIPTAMALGVLTKGNKCQAAGGIVMQALPGCDDETAKKAEEIILKYSQISSLIAEKGVLGIINDDFSSHTFTERDTKYKCVCSQKYIDKVILSLDKTEVKEILKEQGKIEVHCEFCNKNYVYTQEKVNALFGGQFDD